MLWAPPDKSSRTLQVLRKTTEELDRPWDIIAINEPPDSFSFLTERYVPWYGTTQLREEDHPFLPVSRQEGRKQRHASLSTAARPPKCLGIKVAFYVERSITVGDWYVTEPEGGDPNRGCVATLHLKTSSGEIHITNVYNHENRVCIPSLMKFLSGDGYDLVVGDFNLHHPHWEGHHKSAPCTPKARELHLATQAASMKLLTPQGTTTFKKTAGPGGTHSTIDLAFGAEEILKRQPVHTTDDIFTQDHLLMDIQLSMDVSRIARTVYLTRNLDKAALRQLVKEWLHKHFGPPELLGTSHPLRSARDIDQFTRYLTECLSVPFYELVEKIEISATRIVRFVTNNVKRYQDQEVKARAEYDLKGDMATFLRWRTAASLRALVDRKHRREMWRRHASTTGRRVSTIYKMVKGVSRRLRPKVCPRMGPLKDEQSEVLVHDPAGIVDQFLSSQFGKENIGLAPTPCSSLPSKQTATDDSIDDAVPTVDPSDIKLILAKLRSGAAMGPDGVPNFVLKTCRGQGSEACGDPFWEMIIEPYLAHLFQACLMLGYQPSAWKLAITIALLKPDKGPRSTRAWRPVALLPCTGKVYEKVVANMLKDIAIKHQLIPHNQFGFAGKSTAAAVEAIVNEVHRAWNRTCRGKGHRKGWFVTIMSLDIRGAYDNVRIEALIETLRAKGIPAWLVRAIESFLRGRRTTVCIPGYQSGEYYVNIGIPQGSPLSPILFLLFASPLLERFDQKIFQGDSLSIAFVDDMYLVVSSPSPEKNNRILAQMFRYILEWSEPNGVRFEGSKNHVMHLRDPRWRKDPVCESYPEIEGMSKDSVCTVMRILGVFMDQYLKWDAHVANWRRWTRPCGRSWYSQRSTYGLSFEHARHMYLSKVRTAMTYCAAAFYMTIQKDRRFRPMPIQSSEYHMPPRSAFNGKHIERLRSLQYNCLHDITSAFHGTASAVLMNELNVEDIGVCLYRLAVTHRAASIDSVEWQRMESRRQSLGTITKYKLARHPFQALGIEARAVRDVAYARYASGNTRASEDEKLKEWRDSRHVRLHEIRKLTKELANLEMCERWSDYCIRRKKGGRSDTAATLEMWDPACLKLYRGLSRPACVMLLFCRSENLPVRRRLYDMGKLVHTPTCQCGRADQTMQHLFLECLLFEEQRDAFLRRAVSPNLTMRCLLREQKNVRAATAWAILFFPLDMFSGVRQYFRFVPPT
ncbi:RNA-directed DNA polymerase from mobile element jockey [Apiospora marii]|uniref:RNA-directed DNA polymerase from mobile element jockey n=1 Tax=Apiospora marii TaxID=335849 RepID=UPI00312D3F3E